MTTTTTDTIPAAWLRAMQRAADNNLSALRVNDSTYAVRSVSNPGTMHLVTVDERGKVSGCDCLGAQNGRICMHQGAVARRLCRERAISIRQPVKLPQPSCKGKSQIFQEEVA